MRGLGSRRPSRCLLGASITGGSVGRCFYPWVSMAPAPLTVQDAWAAASRARGIAGEAVVAALVLLLIGSAPTVAVPDPDSRVRP